MFGNQQSMPQQNQGSAAPGQFGEGNYTRRLGRGLHKFGPMMGGQGGFPMPPGLAQIMNGLGGGPGIGIPGAQGMRGGNPVWGPAQQPMPSAQGYNQGYGGQMPVQPAEEQPKKGGIKGFISNLTTKRTR